MSETRWIARQAARRAFDGAATFDEFDKIADAVAVAILKEARAIAINRSAFNLAKEYEQLIAEFATGNPGEPS